MRRLVPLPLLLLAASTLAGQTLLDHAWPADPSPKLSELGRGVGVVFSPDLSVPNNCRFYEAAGFACFQDADWDRVLDEIHHHNATHPDGRIATLVLETHGTNGNGLKLQESYDPSASRSYISVGALQERLDLDGIAYIILSACNSQRLLRQSIYYSLDPLNGDKLFLPATCGIVDSSPDFDARLSPIMVITPESSHIETTLIGSVSELAPPARRALLASAAAHGIPAPREFALSDIMMQMLLRDPELRLSTGSVTEKLSRDIQPQDRSEALFTRFVQLANAAGRRERAAAVLAQHGKPVSRRASVR